MRNIEKEIGNQLRTFEGEWQDWWAFGGAAMPREMEVARRAVYHTKAISSPVWGELNSGAKDELKEINRLLCRYLNIHMVLMRLQRHLIVYIRKDS